MGGIAISTSTNPNWPMLATLTPQLRQHINTYPQDYRGDRWYILHDESSGRHIRFNQSAYEFIGRLDGDHSCEEIWQKIHNKQGEETISQDDIIMILSQLLAIDALKTDIPVNAGEFFNRFNRNRTASRQRAVMNPLAIRTPLFDPDRTLNRFMPWVRPLFSSAAGVLWLLVVGFACILGLINFPAISAAVNQDILAPANVLSMALLFILVKLVHEFGHAFAVKMWGGEVHEMGITLLVLMPVPYVDASAAWSFRDKRKRMLVGAAGILVELFIAALALLAWLAVEPGFIRQLALNTLLISGLSTLLFNANPLLRFDGYYVLQDLAEIPNLYSRASRYYLYLIQRYLFGINSVRSPVSADGEQWWFAGYGLAAFCYRLLILVTIVLFLAQEYLFIGVALGTWAIVMQVIMPIVRGIRYLLQGTIPSGQRRRANTVTATVLIGFASAIVFIPAPLTTQAEGILWVSEQAQIYSKSSGFVTELLVKPGAPVEQGTALLRLTNPALLSRIALVKARCQELQTRIASEQIKQRVQGQITEQELTTTKAELALLEEQAANLIIYSQVTGVFVQADQQTLAGRYLNQGDLLGYIVSPEQLVVKTVIPQSSIGLVQQHVSRVELRFAERIHDTVSAQIARQTPAGGTTLPSRALGAAGGGKIAIERSDKSGLTASEKIFLVDLALPKDLETLAGLGERAYIRFNHGSEPLARQWWRSGRQLILSRLEV